MTFRCITAVHGSAHFLKADAFVSTVRRRYDSAGADMVIASFAKVVSTETLESFARALAFKHKKGGIDYPAKFGITLPSATPPARSAGR